MANRRDKASTGFVSIALIIKISTELVVYSIIELQLYAKTAHVYNSI